MFNNRPDLKKHIRRVHVKPFKCDRCEMAFGGSFKLKEHVRSVHEGIRNFKCELCEKAFGFQRDELNFHQDIKFRLQILMKLSITGNYSVSQSNLPVT